MTVTETTTSAAINQPKPADGTPFLGLAIVAIIGLVVLAYFGSKSQDDRHQQEVRAVMMEYRETNPYKYAAELCRLARNKKERDQYCQSF